MSAIDPNPHKEQGLEIYGAPLNQAKLAVVLLHGRRQSAEEAYKNGEAIGLADVAYILPIAKDRTWYPHSFMAPVDSNQPSLDHALDCVSATIEELRGYGFADRQIVLMGFSQGACLATEYIYRRPAAIGGLIAFSGGLFGPDEAAWGSPAAALDFPAFFGTSDSDSWMPLERIESTAQAFRRAGADVDFRVYPDMPHHVCADEIDAARDLLSELLQPQASLN
nr:phospholipase/carboxylesterase [Chromobacterium sp.]